MAIDHLIAALLRSVGTGNQLQTGRNVARFEVFHILRVDSIGDAEVLACRHP